MRKTAIIASLFLMITSTLLAADQKTVRKSVALDANGRLTIDSHNGSITVKTWNQPTVDIDARIVADDDATAEDVAATEVVVSGSGGSARVESNYDKVTGRGWFGFDRVSPPVHYTISMPATASLSISSHNSDIRVSGLRGDLEIEEHNGGIQVADHDGAVTIESHNGDVNVAFRRFAKDSTIETHNGSIEVHAPAQSAFRIDAEGKGLGLESDFAMVSRTMDRDRLVGEVNGGGPRLRLSTHRGGVRVRKS